MHGDGSLYLRGKTWWMKFYRDGRPIAMSCKTPSEDLAKRKLQAEMRKRDDEIAEPRYTRVTIGDLVESVFTYYEAEGMDEYLAEAKRRWNLHLAPVFKDVKAVRFGSADQHKYRAMRLREGDSPTTVNRELQVLRKAFKLAYEEEPPRVRRIPKFHFTQEDNARKGFLNRTQMEALKDVAAKYSLGMRAMIEAAHMFGWRRGELTDLRISNVHLDTNTIRLEDSKNGDAREIPMTQALRTYVEALIVGRGPDERLFGMTEGQVQHAWVTVRKAAGLDTVMFHDLRRTSARSKRSAGVDTSITMSMMGWRTEKMFRRYGICSTEDKVEALQKIEQYEKAAAGTAIN